MTRLVGIHGKAGSGKDTAADFIIKHNPEFVKYSFAQPLKETVNQMFGWGYEEGWGDNKERKVLAPYNLDRACRAVDENLGDTLRAIQCTTSDYKIVNAFIDALNKSGEYKMYDVTMSHFDMVLYGTPRLAYQIFGTEVMRNLVHENFWIEAARIFCEKNSNVIIPDVRFENEADFVRENGELIVIDRPDNSLDVGQHASEAGIKILESDHMIYNHGGLAAFEGMTLALINLLNSHEKYGVVNE